jgi:hypothetical protein
MFGENDSESEGESIVPVWVPIPIEELSSEVEWSREEKVSKIAELLKTQQQRHCFIKLDYEKTQPLQTLFVADHSISSDFLLDYEHAVYRAQGALPAAEVDVILDEYGRRFLSAVNQRFLEESSELTEFGARATTNT